MGDMMTRWQGMVMSAPHKATATGNNLSLAIAAPKIERLVVNIQPVQSGSGTPSPSNVRPISGHSTVSVMISADSHTRTLGGTYYGGTLDMLTGALTVTDGFLTFDGSSDEEWKVENLSSGKNFYIVVPLSSGYDAEHLMCNMLETRGSKSYQTGLCYISGSKNLNAHIGTLIGATTVQALKTWLASHPMQLVYKLATPQTYQLDPQTIRALTGRLTVSTDAGSIDITYYTV